MTRLHGSTSADLLAIPVIMLGFHPRESCVVLGVRASRVEFCARMDLDWFTTGFTFGDVAEQLDHAISRCEGCSVAVLAYSNDPEAAVIAVEELVGVIGEEDVAEVLVTDGDRFWYVEMGILLPPEGVSYSYASSNFAAQAVYSGVNVTPCRDDAVAEVQPPAESDEPGLEETVAASTLRLHALTGEHRWKLLARHMDNPEPLGTEAVDFAVLLQEEEHFAEVMAQLNADTAPRLRRRLAEARRASSAAIAANVVALLALACWLDGEGAQQSDCLTQLEALEPHHPLMRILRQMHKEAIPPRNWKASRGAVG